MRLARARQSFPEFDHSDELVEVAAWLELAKPTAVSRQLDRLVHLQGSLQQLAEAMVSLTSLLVAVAGVESQADPEATALRGQVSLLKVWSINSIAGWVVELAEVRSWLWRLKHAEGRTTQQAADLTELNLLVARVQRTLMFTLAWHRMASVTPWARELLVNGSSRTDGVL